MPFGFPARTLMDGTRYTTLGMVPRGEVGLIFVAVGSTLMIGGRPLLAPEVQAGIVGAILLTTILGPIGLGRALKAPTKVHSD